MAKRAGAIGSPKKRSPHKTKKRLAVKAAMLEARAVRLKKRVK